jgi:hypothetical protein
MSTEPFEIGKGNGKAAAREELRGTGGNSAGNEAPTPDFAWAQGCDPLSPKVEVASLQF